MTIEGSEHMEVNRATEIMVLTRKYLLFFEDLGGGVGGGEVFLGCGSFLILSTSVCGSVTLPFVTLTT